jgi:hypothetical protein
VSFTSVTVTSATFNFVSVSRRLTQLLAYNGGTSPNQVSVRCAGQPDVTVIVPGGAVQVINTGWIDVCSAVTLDSANGWYTNFNNLVIE